MTHYYDDDLPTYEEVLVSKIQGLNRALRRPVDQHSKGSIDELEGNLMGLEKMLLAKCRSEALESLLEERTQELFCSAAGYHTHAMMRKKEPK